MNHLKISESLSQRIRGFLGKILRYIYPFSISKSIYIFFKFIGFFEVNLKGKTFNFFSARDEVAADIFYSGMLDEQTGYIRLTRFSKNSAKEVKKILREL